jgi:type VI secretion system protein ImpA
MPLREDLLTPIAGENPSGQDVRHDNKLLIYDQLKEARRQEDDLPQGQWQHERKVADYPLVIKTGQEALASRTKDLQIAAWLSEAMLHTEGFAGLQQGLSLCRGLIANFWDSLYPPIEDGDMELRAAPLDWLGSSIEIPLKSQPLNKGGHNWFKFKESRVVGYEEQAQTEKEKKARAKSITEGKLPPETFDKSFVETPKAFYLQAEKSLDGCLAGLKGLDELCNEKFADSAPSFAKLKIALEEVRHTVHQLLQKKRETEPDPVEPVAAAPAPAEGETGTNGAGSATVPAGEGGIVLSLATSSEPADRRDAIASVAQVALFLRKREPNSPAPYLMMRGLRWGELRAAPQLSDPKLLEAPPTELRQHVKRLALSSKWNELLDVAEGAMALPCSRGWLDLQRMVVTACTALGTEYEPIASAIRSELRSLLNDVPQLLDATLLDDTPAANAETRAWIQQFSTTMVAATPAAPAPAPAEGQTAAPAVPAQKQVSWLEKAADPFAMAKEALAAGQADKAFEIMRKEIAAQRSGRSRFERTMQLVELCVGAGKDAIAQPLLDDLAAAIETHKLDDWEDKQMVAAALAAVMKLSKKIQGNAAEKQKLFERICRLDPVRALSLG